MGIYLPKMEMPRKGQMLVIFPDGTSYVCFNGMRERIAQTEAVPVPPHGRCIDADALKQNTYEIYDPMGIIEAVPVDVIDNAPTVIEAEEGET